MMDSQPDPWSLRHFGREIEFGAGTLSRQNERTGEWEPIPGSCKSFRVFLDAETGGFPPTQLNPCPCSEP